MNRWLIIFLSLIYNVAQAYTPIDCSGTENQRNNIIEIREFNCESEIECGVGVWAPSIIEGRSFLGFSVVQNLTAPNKYDLEFDLESHPFEDERAGYLYGTRKTLEEIMVTASYSRKGNGCPLRSSVQLKHNNGN